ncbi:unnamed protein product [Prunus brigantina]
MRPLRNLYRAAYRSIVKKLRHDKKKSSPDREAKVDQIGTSITNDVIFEEVGDDTPKAEKKTMHGFHSFRCISLQRMRRDHDTPSPKAKGHFKQSSLDNFFNMHCHHFSKSSSRRSHTPSPSLKKTKSRKSWPDSIPSPSTPKAATCTKSADSTPAHPSLSKCESRKTPIMFSNSSGMLKPPAVEKQLECTLEELCFGCQKKMKVTRAIVKDTGQMVEEEEVVTINVKPGWKKGTKITFEGLGNEIPGAYPADIVFVIAEKRHPLFRREGDDLELALEIPLVKALTGCIISIPLLGGDQMKLTIDDIIYPGYEKVISEQGMAISKDEGKRANLKLTFLVDFPTFLTDEQRSDILNILEDSYY